MSNNTFRTHYDNLQVARTASDAVIRAAYKSLAQQYHPDRAQDNVAQAEQAMQIVNVAYQVLSNPDARRQHDLWIAEMEQQQRIQAVPAQLERQDDLPVIESSRLDASRIASLTGIRPQYRAPRAGSGLFSRLFGWLLLVFAGASMLPLAGQIFYWFRFKTWVALPARLAFGHNSNLPAGIGSLLPGNDLAPSIADWLYHPTGLLGVHAVVYSLLDTLNISVFYLIATISVFYLLQLLKEKLGIRIG